MRNECRKKSAITFFYLVLILFVGFSFFLDAIRLISVKNNIDNQTVIRNFCGYELTKIKTGRNTSYLFVLDDGDRLFVEGELLENKDIIDAHKKLYFTYVTPRGGTHFSYTCIKITSYNEKVQFVNQTLAIREVELGILVNFLIAVPIILFFFVIFIYKLIMIKHKWK